MHNRMWSLVPTLVATLAFLGTGISEGAAPEAAKAKPDSATQKLAKQLVDKAGMQRGLCAVLGRDRDMALQLAKASELLVNVRVPDMQTADELNHQAAEQNVGISRLAIGKGRTDKLPYAENVVDLVVVTNGMEVGPDNISLEEILRVLRPEGTAIVGQAAGAGGESVSSDLIEMWASAGNTDGLKAWEDESGSWVQFQKPALKGADSWSHWEHGPDNNPVSTDSVIKAPYMTQFMADPLYIAMPSITTAAGGRTFLAIGHITHHRREWDWMNKLIARNGYNGTVLWERKLPEGYLVHRSAFIATPENFYMIEGNHCLVLDPQTGEEKSKIEIPGLEGDWKWMVLNDGVLYALAGDKDPEAEPVKGERTFGGWSWADLSKGYYTKPNVPWGFGKTLAAYRLADNKVLWTHKDDALIDSRSLSMGDDKLSVYSPGAHFRCLDTKTGEIVWSNNDPTLLDLIEEEGQNLISTPGFRTACICVYTPNAFIIQGQTRMNVVALSTTDGYHLWTKKKVTNNPNAIYVDGNLILGVGEDKGNHVVVDPETGDILENLGFRKAACTRLTASSDSFFCRGEGTLRFDRETKKALVDGSVRPACNDGAMPANGLLYLGPWQCDCNLSLIGNIARCSAGDFSFDFKATDASNLERGAKKGDLAPFAVTDQDWSTYRGNNARSGSSSVSVPAQARPKWVYTPEVAYIPTAPTAANGLIFVSGDDGRVRAIDAKNGKLRWQYQTSAPIKSPPTIAHDLAYFGSGDGYVYAVEAATGKLVWRFRAAPIERDIMVYGHIGSTWPVNTGVLVNGDTIYFAAGIIDYDGTSVYALDAKTGKIKWQNHASGHLNDELRKGVSAQGNLSIQGNQLLLAGGNQISPASFDLETGECMVTARDHGNPQANSGHFTGVFHGDIPIIGGRILYSAPENVSTKGSFSAITHGGRGQQAISYGGIPPAWDKDDFVMVNFLRGKITDYDPNMVADRMKEGPNDKKGIGASRKRMNMADDFVDDGARRWETDLGQPERFETLSMAVCPNAIIAVVQYQELARSQPEWHVVALDRKTGEELWNTNRTVLPSLPFPGGLLVDRDGQAIVILMDGSIVCVGGNGKAVASR